MSVEGGKSSSCFGPEEPSLYFGNSKTGLKSKRFRDAVARNRAAMESQIAESEIIDYGAFVKECRVPNDLVPLLKNAQFGNCDDFLYWFRDLTSGVYYFFLWEIPGR